MPIPGPVAKRPEQKDEWAKRQHQHHTEPQQTVPATEVRIEPDAQRALNRLGARDECVLSRRRRRGCEACHDGDCGEKSRGYEQSTASLKPILHVLPLCR